MGAMLFSIRSTTVAFTISTCNLQGVTYSHPRMESKNAASLDEAADKYAFRAPRGQNSVKNCLGRLWSNSNPLLVRTGAAEMQHSAD